MRERLRAWASGRAVAILTLAAITATLLSACSLPLGTGTATISGTVTLPEEVELSDDTVIDVSILLPGDEGVIAHALTARDGSYTVTRVPPGDYTMYVSVFAADIAPQWWGGSTSARAADTFRVEAGEARTGMDVSLVKGATLSGTLSMPRESQGRVERAWVTVWDAQERIWRGDSAVSEHGEYVVSGLAAGEYKIEVVPARASAARQWVGGASDWTGARIIPLDASTNLTGLDVALTLGGSIAGVVSGAAANEFGASVYATLRAADGAWEEGSWSQVGARRNLHDQRARARELRGDVQPSHPRSALGRRRNGNGAPVI